MTDRDTSPYFALLNEIGIIAQLSRALIETRMPPGMLLPHFSVLNHLIRVRDGGTPLDLARAFQVPKTSMTHTLAGLQERGLIRMEPNPRDGRSKQVWITEEGRAFRDGTIAALQPDLARMAGAVDAERAAAALPFLQDLRRHLDAARDPEI